MSIARHVGLAAPVAVWLLALALAPSNALAQAAEKGPGKAERAAAREAYDKGTASFDRGDYVSALDSFVKANALIPSVQAMYWIAQAQDKLNHTEAAIEAYEAITSRADFSKLSEDKAATVRERLAALKAQTSLPPAAPAPAPAPTDSAAGVEPAPAEPTPLVAAMPPPPISDPPPIDDPKDVLPQKNTAELGVMGGVLFVSNSNNLADHGKTPHEFENPAFQIGARAAFFPVSVFGVEAEYAHGFAKVEKVRGDVGGTRTNFDIVRGHLIGQLPTSRLVPFALLGAGMLRGRSDPTGPDTDFDLQVGAGLKVMATELIVPRLDLRLNLTQKDGGGFFDGIAAHPEILLGVSFTLGR
jgi:hypothetical protein